MRKKITLREIEKLKPKDKPYNLEDSECKGFVVRVEPSGRTIYAVRFRVNGRQSQMKIGATNTMPPEQARRKAAKIRGEAQDGIDPLQAARAARANEVGTFIETEYAVKVLRHKRSGDATLARLKACFAFLWKRKIGDPTMAVAVTNWRSKRLKEGTSTATLNRDIGALRAAFSWAVQQGLIKIHPLDSVRREKVDVKPAVRFLSRDEEKQLFTALDAREEKIRSERDSANVERRKRGYDEYPDLRTVAYADHLKPMVQVSLNTGLRRGELFNLTWHDVDDASGILTVRGEGAKSGKTRHVPLNATALEVLRAWKAQSGDKGRVFKSAGGARFDNVNTSWRQILKDARIDRFRWHDLRHTFASRLVQAHVDLYVVKELLGHATVAMTERYSHLAPRATAQAVAKLDPSANVVALKGKEATQDVAKPAAVAG